MEIMLVFVLINRIEIFCFGLWCSRSNDQSVVKSLIQMSVNDQSEAALEFGILTDVNPVNFSS